jgi:DNA-binding MarR family transcriptional regulator
MLTEKYLTSLCKSFYDFKYSLFKVIERLCKEEGLTAMQTMILFTLRSEGAMSVGTISGMFNITQSNASAMCKKLEKDGLICRARSKTDERTVMITLGEKGREALERMLVRGKPFGNALESIDPERLDTILEIMNDATAILGDLTKQI